MKRIIFEMPSRDWKEYRIQGVTGKIVKDNNKFKIEVEVMELPGECVYYDYVFPYELKDEFIDRTVIGDIGEGGFTIRILGVFANITVL